MLSRFTQSIKHIANITADSPEYLILGLEKLKINSISCRTWLPSGNLIKAARKDARMEIRRYCLCIMRIYYRWMQNVIEPDATETMESPLIGAPLIESQRTDRMFSFATSDAASNTL